MEKSEEFKDYEPVWGRVLVLPIDIEETDEVLKKAKEFGLILKDESIKQEQYAQNEGILIFAGGDCFDNWNKKGRIPKVGDRVLYNKYAGFILKDGKHRIINDTDIQACIGE